MRNKNLFAMVSMVFALLLTTPEAAADVTLRVHSPSAPDVYISNIDGYNEWPGKTLTTQEGDYWWECKIKTDVAPAIVILSRQVGDTRYQSRDITGLGSGCHYLWYNGYNMHINVTDVRYKKAYAFLQPMPMTSPGTRTARRSTAVTGC